MVARPAYLKETDMKCTQAKQPTPVAADAVKWFAELLREGAAKHDERQG